MQIRTGQWVVDWAIQSVLKRDRKYKPRRVGDESSKMAAKVRKKGKRVQASDSESAMPRNKGNMRRHERPIAPPRVNHDKRSFSHDGIAMRTPTSMNQMQVDIPYPLMSKIIST